MTRGEVWTVAGGSAYTGKPRPAVIIQDDRFDATHSILICPFTTNPTPASFRVLVQPTADNGLRVSCRLMVDKVTAVPRTRLKRWGGVLAADDMKALNRALFVFLGLSG